MLTVTRQKREFKFKKDGTTVTLPDPNPEFTEEEVMQFYSAQYPELTTATVDEPSVVGKTRVHNVRTTVGTKA